MSVFSDTELAYFEERKLVWFTIEGLEGTDLLTTTPTRGR